LSQELFIETPKFPVTDVNRASISEKRGGGRPDYWEMIFWWTRKPLAGARAVVAGSVLPATTDPNEFRYNLRFTERVAHRKNPVKSPSWIEKFRKIKLLDPFAGFGSIPLEAIRLGVGEVVACELLPVAYVFLKAVLEHPKWAVERGLGEKLREDVKKWGNWIIEQLKQDPDIRELYDEDIAVYIGTWEVKCPHCSKWTPLIGNWWLARVKRGVSIEEEEGEEESEGARGEFKRLVWMEPVKVGDEILIRVIDLNRELNIETINATVNSRVGTVIVEDKTYRVPRPNIEGKREVATCLHCNNQLRKGKTEWYVKEALKTWNNKLGQYYSGIINLKTLLNETPVRPRLLVKVKIVNKELEFEPATKEDNEKLWRALEKLKAVWGDPDIPTELTEPYCSSTYHTIVWGFDRFYKLFNPRQLLVLVKLVKLIREAGRRVEEEKIREGWSREDAFKYAEAVTTYLAIWLVNFVRYDSMVTCWDATYWGLLKVKQSLSMRGIAMMWNWCEFEPVLGTKTFLPYAIDGLSYLVSAVSGSPSRVRVLLDDATTLSKLGGEKFDLIVTDPPYRDDVPYAELSDFYYVWLKRVLSDVVDLGGVLVRKPGFISEAFFDEYGSEIEVQWKVFAPREISENEGRSEVFGLISIGGRRVPVGSFDHFKQLLSESFKTMTSRLSDSGVLVTYYAHTTPEAWEALLEAGWVNAGLKITATHALLTESPQRVTARGATTLDMSIVVVWKKSVAGEALVDEVYARAVEVCSEIADKYRRAGYTGVNLFVSVLGCVLSQFTQYRRVIGTRSLEDMVKNYVYPATAGAIAKSLTGVEVKLSPYSQFYMLAKVLVDRVRRTRRRLDSTTLVILSIGTRAEISHLNALRVVGKVDDEWVLLEPVFSRDIRASIEEVLREKNVNPQVSSFRSPIDVLHVLEYLAITEKSDVFKKRVEEIKSKSGLLVDEAIAVMRVFKEALPEEDVERRLAEKVIESFRAYTGTGLTMFTRK